MLNRLVLVLAVAAASSAASLVSQVVPPADLVLVNARILTVDPGFSEARAVAIRGGRFVAVGSDAQARLHVGDATRLIDGPGDVLHLDRSIVAILDHWRPMGG